MDEERIGFLARLSEAPGPSGFERPVAKMLKERVLPHVDSVDNDGLGGLMFTREGEGPRVLVAAHMDEVGFMVTGITEEGFLRFTPLGGWFDQVLLAKRVLVMSPRGKTVGVIASKPPHLLEREEREKVFEQRDMYIDVGCTGRREVEEMGIRVGDPVVPVSPFSTSSRRGEDDERRTLAFGKALDDRVGVFIVAELMRRLHEEDVRHPNVVIGAGTVQEELGMRGARTMARMTSPDLALVIDVDDSGDLPGMTAEKAPLMMGKGAGIALHSPCMMTNRRLLDVVVDVAERNGIPHQVGHVYGGCTDAGAIHLNDIGCPSIFISVPMRHMHSHVGILDMGDVEAVTDLLLELVRALDSGMVGSLTEVHGQ